MAKAFPATKYMRLSIPKPVPTNAKGRLLAGHLVAGRIQDLFPADGA